MSGTFEAAKDLIELSAVSLLPYGENPPAPMPWVLSRGKLAMVCCSKIPPWHRSQSWSRLSSNSADSHLPAAQKEISAMAAGWREEALERERCSLAPPRDWHQEELRRLSPEDSCRWSHPGPGPRDTGTAPTQPGATRSPAGADYWHCHGLHDRRRRCPAPTSATIATRTGLQTAGTLRGTGNPNGASRSLTLLDPLGLSGAPRGPVQGKLLSAAVPVPALTPDGAGGYSIQASSIPPA
ncbi:uncharacterized protein LOC122459345 [Dermochelys coriacea]|uniref:uncharacterized protein LOC122459345 n=1 Tax=Dermochelys coriacea TaxID=27794 RepID=UPI001CA90BC3|nr:uncharacterized protein LOC122459345 [Dermochelys coriacea]